MHLLFVDVIVFIKKSFDNMAKRLHINCFNIKPTITFSIREITKYKAPQVIFLDFIILIKVQMNE